MLDSYGNNVVSFNQSSSSYYGGTAEFIAERPTITNTSVNPPTSFKATLTNFSYVQFLDAWVNGTGTAHAFANYPNKVLDIYTAGGKELSTPGGYFNSGQSFYDNWINCG